MGKIKGWKKIEDKIWMDRREVTWVPLRAHDWKQGVRIMQIPDISQYRVTITTNSAQDKVKMFNTFKEAYGFAVVWMRKHP